MGIEVVCWNCSRKLIVEDAFAGKEGRCPFCMTVLVIPGIEKQGTSPGPETPTPAPAWAAEPETTAPETPPEQQPEPRSEMAPIPPEQAETQPEQEPETVEHAEAEPVQPPEPIEGAVPPKRSVVGRALIAGGTLVALAVLIAAAWFGTMWYENYSKSAAKPPVKTTIPPKQPEPDKPKPPQEPDKPAKPVEPVKPAAPVFPLTEDVVSHIPPGCIGYAEIPAPGKLLDAFAKQRLWQDPEAAGSVITLGLKEFAHGIANDLNLPGDKLIEAAGKAESLHLCLIDWLQRPRWALMARYKEPVTFEGLLGAAAKSLQNSKFGSWQGVDLIRLRIKQAKQSQQRMTAACCGRYVIIASDDTAARMVVESVKHPPGEGRFGRPSMAQLPAFREALESRPKTGDDLWLFADMPMLVDQMARWSATRDARSLVKLDQTINLRTIAAMVGSVNLSGAPAMSLDIMLKKNHPLMKPLAGPPLKTELPGPLPADTALVARFGVGDPKAAWHAFGQVLEAIDPVLALNLKKLRMSIDHKFGASAWQKVAPALGGEAMFFAVKKPESANDVGLIATAKDEAALKALTDLVGQAPAVQKLAMTQEDIGGIVLNHPEKVDVFPCYARIDGLLLLTARRALARAAIDAHIEKKGPAAEEINAALERLQPASMLLLAKADALELARKDRLKPGSWMAAGLTIAPDRLTLSLSDPALFLPAIEILSEESKKKAQRQIADCKRRLREVGKAVLVATAADPQLCYPRTFAKVLE